MGALKNGVEQNKQNIRSNKRTIEENKSAITDLRCNHVSLAVFEKTVDKYDRIVHRLIVALCIIVTLLLVSNAVWVYLWSRSDFGKTNVFAKDTNFIGRDGEITNGGSD